MRILTLAAGLAAGYVLGTRAGREKYEQIAETARKASAHPTVVQARENAKALINGNTTPGSSSRTHSTPTADTTPTVVLVDDKLV